MSLAVYKFTARYTSSFLLSLCFLFTSIVPVSSKNSNVKNIGVEDKGLQNAARVAFIKEGTVASTASGSALTQVSGTSFANGNADTVIWEPNVGSHTAEAATSANSTSPKFPPSTTCPAISSTRP